MNMGDIIIIGGGPAGVSASLYTARGGIFTRIISKSRGALQKADKIENYYGFPSPISGKDLERQGIDGAKRVGVAFIDEEVVSLSYDGKFTVETDLNKYSADSVIIATGSPRKTPALKGVAEFEGRGVSYCAVCDAFFYRGKNVAVIGSGEYAVSEAKELLPVVASVTLLTDGAKLETSIPDGVSVDGRKISMVRGGSRVEGIVFDDGGELQADGVFIAYGVAGSADLARKMGALTEGNTILTNDRMETNIPGLFAAGDCTGGLLQISKAVYDGARAGTEAIKYLRKK